LLSSNQGGLRLTIDSARVYTLNIYQTINQKIQNQVSKLNTRLPEEGGYRFDTKVSLLIPLC
jgi:hypothetical protein